VGARVCCARLCVLVRWLRGRRSGEGEGQARGGDSGRYWRVRWPDGRL
jgi:hypothetical protein